MLERRIAVGDQRHVHPEQRPALGDDLHILAPRGLDHLLALLAARLVVILDAARALRLQAADVRQRIVEAVDLRIDVGRLGAIDDLAGREDARADDQPGLLQLGGGEDLARARRRIVDRRRAEREILVRRPILLRDDLVRALRPVRVRVDQAGDDRLARDIDHRRAGRNRDLAAAADRGDAVAANDDDAVLDHPAARIGHRHDPRAGQRRRCRLA